LALEADEVKSLEARATVFGVGAGVATGSSAESLAREGDPAACEEALRSGKETPLCSVPLRVGLLALDGLASDGSGVAAAAPEKPATGPASCPEGMARVEGGSLTMDGKREDVGTFCIDKQEATAAAYSACVDGRTCQAPSEKPREFCTYRQAGKGRHPMNCVTIDEAKAFCQSRGLLLPTEQQAELAARGLQGRRYPWGEAEEEARVCMGRRNEGTCVAGSLPSGATPEGVVDLAGNVAELVESARGHRTFGGDFSDKKLKDVSPEERGVSTSPSPKIGFRCATR
jgi:formylglycine-generating enzyme required for sulfatase activity